MIFFSLLAALFTPSPILTLWKCRAVAHDAWIEAGCDGLDPLLMLDDLLTDESEIIQELASKSPQFRQWAERRLGRSLLPPAPRGAYLTTDEIAAFAMNRAKQDTPPLTTLTEYKKLTGRE